MTKFDHLQASLARVGLIGLLLLMKTNDGGFFNFKFGCRTELLIIISPNIFFFKGSR